MSLICLLQQLVSGLDIKVDRCPGKMVTTPQLVAVGVDGKHPCLTHWTPGQTSICERKLLLLRRDVLAGL